jgi:hypothetical protein
MHQGYKNGVFTDSVLDDFRRNKALVIRVKIRDFKAFPFELTTAVENSFMLNF